MILPILTTSFIRFSLKGWANVLFELGIERVKSCQAQPEKSPDFNGNRTHDLRDTSSIPVEARLFFSGSLWPLPSFFITAIVTPLLLLVPRLTNVYDLSYISSPLLPSKHWTRTIHLYDAELSSMSLNFVKNKSKSLSYLKSGTRIYPITKSLKIMFTVGSGNPSTSPPEAPECGPS